jgi:hypothetical protein
MQQRRWQFEISWRFNRGANSQCNWIEFEPGEDVVTKALIFRYFKVL